MLRLFCQLQHMILLLPIRMCAILDYRRPFPDAIMPLHFDPFLVIVFTEKFSTNSNLKGATNSGEGPFRTLTVLTPAQNMKAGARFYKMTDNYLLPKIFGGFCVSPVALGKSLAT